MGANQRPEELINYYVQSSSAARNIASAAGFFALLWSTVVLLGGFVSVLPVKDFWFLSLLSFLMASRMLMDMDFSTAWDYVVDIDILRLRNQLEGEGRRPHWTLTFILSTGLIVKTIVIICVALPIVLVAPYVALALSVARLVQRDYGDVGGDAANKAKLTASLIIFYVLVTFQSLSVFYWAFLDGSEPWMLVSKQSGFGIWGPKIIRKYQEKTIAMCRKDGGLPNNWNLITFSVGLLGSATQDGRHLWGARALDTFIGKGIPVRHELLTSSQAIQNLIDMVIAPTRTDGPEIRESAARIVAYLASELRITQFPNALRCICCLLESSKQYSDPAVAQPLENSEQTDRNSHKPSVETFEHGHQQEDAHLSLAIIEQTDHEHQPSRELPKGKSWIQTIINVLNKSRVPEWDKYFGDKYHYSYVSKGTKELISQGLVILERLTQNEENCIEIIKHQRLLSKIILPLSYQDFLSNGCDHTWVDILSRSLTSVSRLISVGPTDETTRLRHDMSRNTVAIRNLMRILEVDSKGARELYGRAIEILTELAFDDSLRKLAFREPTNMTKMFVKTLQRIFLGDNDGNTIVAKQDEEKDKRVRRKAGEALGKLLRVPSARDNTDASTSATTVNVVDLLPKEDALNLLTRVVDQILSSKPKKATRVGTRQSSTQENVEQPEEKKMLAAILSLTVVICNNKNVISRDDLTRAISDNDASFVKKLKEIVETNMDTTIEGWRILKLVCQVVITVVQLKPSCTREFNEHNFKETLSKALDTMKDVDICMIFAGDDHEVPPRSFTSLVKEAHEFLAKDQGDIISTG